MAASQIDDGEPPVPKSHSAFCMETFAIRTSMTQRVSHAPKDAGIRLGITGKAEQACQTAHAMLILLTQSAKAGRSGALREKR
ncbi:hypothetical protein HMPREF9946_04815 [Acetobacteraceae bacterium AT-5844]|nr:hypothetical protein HMPREF9946_04815 [Acetobacteraceae bacterium AT-5844]